MCIRDSLWSAQLEAAERKRESKALYARNLRRLHGEGRGALEEAARRDRAVAQALHEFNVKLRKDARVDQLLLPLRDGLTVVTRVK